MANYELGYETEISNKILKTKQRLLSKANTDKDTRNISHELSRAYNKRGFYHYMMVDFYPAIEDYNESILLDSRFEIAFYNRGLVRYRLGMYSQSKDDLERCLQINPEFVEATLALKQVLKDIKEGRSFGQ